MNKKILSSLFRGLFVFILCLSILPGIAYAQWTEDTLTSTVYPTSTTYGVAIGQTNSQGHTLDVQGLNDIDNDFMFRGSSGLSGERDIFTIYDTDQQGANQDESSVFKIFRYWPFNDNADGATLAEFTFKGSVPTVEDRQFYILGRGGVNEGPVSWGISANDSDFWTIGDIHGGATGADCGATGAACFNSPSYELSASGDSYINGGNLGIGTSTPSEALDVAGNVVASGTICDSTGCIGSGSGTGTSVWSTSGSDAYYDAGNVGIGTTSPIAGLNVVSDAGAIFTGTFGTGSLAVSGAGTRMIWYPGKAAFRSGYVGDAQWDDANIGNYSVAMGNGTWATGEYSTSLGTGGHADGEASVAAGFNNYATGNNSVAMGNNNHATGNSSVAMGDNSTASGYVATVLGANNQATGNYSTAMGVSATASGYSAMALGNDILASGDYSLATGKSHVAEAYGVFLTGRYGNGSGTTNSWVDTEPLFVVGNGTDSSNLNNALTVYKNGNAELDGDFTATGQICDSTGCIGSGSGSTSYSLTSGYLPYYNGSDLVDTDIYYDSFSGQPNVAFGATNNTSTGGYSLVSGWNSNATGFISTALGNGVEASGTYSTAIGSGAVASGTSAIALGNGEAIGSSSFASGSNTVATGMRSTAMGNSTEAVANYSTAMGDDTIANGNFSFAMGRDLTADPYNSFVIGRYNYTDSSWTGTSWDNDDPLFIIGNGSSSTDLNNAFTVYKDGDVEVDGIITADGVMCIGSGC